ncbi:MAG: bile acid:sodium symporter [Microbacteriaceae bacterium]|nr:bile acid:sodium symporter [Microbacteriaceae bacterium]
MIDSLLVMAAETTNQATVVNEFEQLLLRIFILIIMFGLGAGLTPRDFGLALRRPWGLVIGWLTQFGIMPLTAYLLVITVLLPFTTGPDVAFIALGALIMGSVPAGTTSNLFTYFSKGNLALSVTMTVNSTLWAFVMTPFMLWIYSSLLNFDESLSINFSELATVIVGLIIPVGLGMLVRRLSANAGAVLELIGGIFGLLFIPFLIAIWVPRNWQLLLTTEWPTYVLSIGLGVVGITFAYFIAKAIRIHPMNVRTIALETGIQNGPLAIAVIVAVYIDNPGLDSILLVPALYSLFIVLISTVVTLIFRRANVKEEQKIPDLL